MYQHGWYIVAFERELTDTLTPAVLGDRRLVIVRTDQGIRVFNADCPHRGAHLGYGGRLNNDCIVCPFHGYRIGLGQEGQVGFQAHEYLTLAVGGLIFIRLSDQHDNGFGEFMSQLAADHYILPGFIMPLKVAAPMVVENAFDARHFPVVHRLKTDKVTVRQEEGLLVVETRIEFPAGPYLQKYNIHYVRSQFTGRAFSPGIIVTRLQGEELPYSVMTAATPQPDGHCILRLALAFPIEKYGTQPDQAFCDRLLVANQRGLQDDQVIWERLSPTAPHRLTSQDSGVIEFQKYCQRFETA